MNTENLKAPGLSLRTALLLALTLPAAALVSGCNKPAEEPPPAPTTEEAMPPPAETPPPTDIAPAPATDPTTTPPPADPNAPPATTEPTTPSDTGQAPTKPGG